MRKRSLSSPAEIVASRPSPQRASRCASSAWRTAKRSGVTGPAVRTLNPPRGVAGDLDARLAGDLADLPRRPAAVLVDVEVRRRPEVAFAPRGEADVAADARDAELLPPLVVEVLADHVPDA